MQYRSHDRTHDTFQEVAHSDGAPETKFVPLDQGSEALTLTLTLNLNLTLTLTLLLPLEQGSEVSRCNPSWFLARAFAWGLHARRISEWRMCTLHASCVCLPNSAYVFDHSDGHG